MKDAKQLEFEKFPERTALGKKGIEYLNLRGRLKGLEDMVTKAKEELIAEFKASGVQKIKIERVIIRYQHSEKDSIAVKGEGEEV